MRVLLRQARAALLAVAVFTALCGLVYPLFVTAVAHLAWPGRADGSLIERDGAVVGSALIGQAFTSPVYFHPRPSAAGIGYDGSASSGSNLGPTNPDFLELVAARVAAYRNENMLAADVLVPADAVTASASGLDPHISLRNARLQAPRVAAARAMALGDVMAAIDEHTTHRPLAILGDPGVNVLELNLALDEVA